MKDKFSLQISKLTERLAASGLRLIDGSAKIKSIAFIGGVRFAPDRSSGDRQRNERRDELEEVKLPYLEGRS